MRTSNALYCLQNDDTGEKVWIGSDEAMAKYSSKPRSDAPFVSIDEMMLFANNEDPSISFWHIVCIKKFFGGSVVPEDE